MWVQQPIHTSHFRQLLDCLPRLKQVNLGLNTERGGYNLQVTKMTYEIPEEGKLTQRHQNVNLQVHCYRARRGA